MLGIRRREFITLLGGAAALPVAARAQQPPVPTIGFLHSASQNANLNLEGAFRKGLGEMGFVDGRNVVIENRYAENQNDRLPTLAAELVRRRVVVIFTSGANLVPIAQAATATIPMPKVSPRAAQRNIPKFPFSVAALIARPTPDQSRGAQYDVPKLDRRLDVGGIVVVVDCWRSDF